jgi:hypothetical protein
MGNRRFIIDSWPQLDPDLGTQLLDIIVIFDLKIYIILSFPIRTNDSEGYNKTEQMNLSNSAS